MMQLILSPWLPAATGLVAFVVACAGRRRSYPVRRPVPGAGPVLGVLVFAAVAIAFGNERNYYLSDNRFIDSWAPERLLGSLYSVWSPDVDLGGPVQHFGPVTDVLLVSLRSVGLDPWFAQRVWFALILVLGASGMALLARVLLPGARWEAVVAGAWFICAPFTSGFFFPTSLLLNVALAPWFALAVWQGATTPSRWRWAAVFAVALSVSGTRNPPGLVMALLPASVLGMALVVGGRVPVRAMGRWIARAGILSVGVLLPVLARIAMSSETLARNLGSTESVEAVSLSSSWSESLRGLGFWLQYWNPRGPLVLPHLTVYFTNWFVVIATFVVPALALLVVTTGRRRIGMVLGAMIALSVALMVGAYPVGAPAPLGEVLRWIYDEIPPLFAFRNVYKAGAGLVIGVGLLLALGVRDVSERLTERGTAGRSLNVLLACVLVTVFVASGWPLLSGNGFRNGQRLEGAIPSYWDDALGWLDAQDGAGRVLILPGSASEDYRWGSAANGDLFPSLLDRPAIFAQPLTGSPAEAANVTAALDRAVTSGRYEMGTVAPIARRLGVQFIVLRNDLDWQRAGVIRPDMLNEFRNDPSLDAVATFGAPGTNVTGDDDSPDADRERRLPPIEIFTVTGTEDVVRAVSPAPALLLSGDGAGWISLARSGALDELGPIRSVAPLSPAQVVDELVRGASVVITDTNRRRPLGWGQEDRTLTELDTEGLDDIFEVPGSDSVASYGDAVRLGYAGPATLFDSGPSNRPAAAFDGDPTTAWLTGINSSPRGQQIRIELAEAAVINEIRLRIAETPGGRTVTRVGVVFPGQEPISFDVTTGVENVVKVPPTLTDLFAIAPLAVAEPGAGPFGFSEISVTGLDLAERVTLPRDIEQLAGGDPEVASLLTTAPLTVEMQRLIGTPSDTENSIARRFHYPARRAVELTGGIQISGGTSAVGLAHLLRSPISVEGTSFNGETAADTLATIDGNPQTSWSVDGRDTARLTVRANGTDLRRMMVVFDRRSDTVLPEVLRVKRAGDELEIEALRQCDRSSNDARGTARVMIEVTTKTCAFEVVWAPGVDETDEVMLELVPSHDGTVDGSPPMKVAEIRIDGTSNTLDLDIDTCREDLLFLDGSPIAVRLGGSFEDLIRGERIPVESCAAIDLSAGSHEVSTVPGLPLDWLRFQTIDGNSPVPATAVDVTVIDRASEHHRLRIDAPAGTHVILGQAYSDRWRADSDKGDLDAVQSMDVQASWTLVADGPQELRVGYAGGRSYNVLALLAVLLLSILPAVIVADPRRRDPAGDVSRCAKESVRACEPEGALDKARAHRGILLAAFAGTSLFAGLTGGWPALVVAVAALFVMSLGWVGPRAIGVAAVGLVCFSFVASVPPFGPSLEPVWPLWPSERGIAHELARLAVVLVLVAICGPLKGPTTNIHSHAAVPSDLDRAADAPTGSEHSR